MNRFTVYRLPFTVYVALALFACGTPEWREMIIPDGDFTVLMRGEAHYARQELDTPSGKMQAHLYSSDRPDSYFAVGYSDYPLSFALSTRADEIFSGVRETWLKRINGRLVASGSENLGKHPGIHFTARGSVKGQEALLEAKVYLVDQRLYQLIAISRSAETPQGVVNRFFKSFRLTTK